MKIKNMLLCALMGAVMLFSGCSESQSASRGNLDEVKLSNGDEIAVFEIENYGTIKAKLFRDIAPVGVENFTKLCEQKYYDGLKIHRVMSDFMFQGGAKNDDGEGGEAAVNGGKFGVEANKNARHFYGALCYANSMGENTVQFYIVNRKTPQDIDKIDISEFEKMASKYKMLAKQAEEAGVSVYAEAYKAQEKSCKTSAEWIRSTPSEVKELYQKRGGTPELDGNYTVFGQVYEGFDVIDAISNAEVTDNGRNEKSKPTTDIVIKSVYVTKYTEG